MGTAHLRGDAVNGLLLLDVDGVLNPYKIPSAALERAGYQCRITTIVSGTYPVWINPAHGQLLGQLAEETGLELAWVTKWGELANRHLAPRLGLPSLPVIDFDHGDPAWKFPVVLAYAAGRPLAWLDDELSVLGDRAAFLAQRGVAPTLLRDVDPMRGLHLDDLRAVRRWALG